MTDFEKKASETGASAQPTLHTLGDAAKLLIIHGFVIQDANSERWRTLDGIGFPDWTDDFDKALMFRNRYHADIFAQDDPADVRIRAVDSNGMLIPLRSYMVQESLKAISHFLHKKSRLAGTIGGDERNSAWILSKASDAVMELANLEPHEFLKIMDRNA